MLKRWLALLLASCLILVVPAAGLWQSGVLQRNMPRAENGRIDLDGWDYERKGAAPLGGEWTFYPGRLIDPEDLAEKDPSGLNAAVPGAWNSAMPEGPLGYGTYRLEIGLGGEANGDYGLRIANIRMASRVYLNGEEVGASGNPSQNLGADVQKNVPYTGFVRLSGTKAVLVVQASNFSYASGGIVDTIAFGPEKIIVHEQQGGWIVDLFALFGFLLPGLLFLLLYALHKRELPQLFLGVFCLLGAVHVLTHGEKLIDYFLPHMPYAAMLKMQAVSSSLFYFFLIAYMNALRLGVIRRSVLIGYAVLAGSGAFLGLVLPMTVFSKLEGVLFLAGFLSLAYTSWIMVRWLRKSAEDLYLVTLGLMSISMFILLSLINLLTRFDTDVLAIYELVLFVFAQTVLLVRRFVRTFTDVERLSERLMTLDGLKDEFMANTSHELRTPLHGIINIARSMLEGAAGPASEKQRENLAMIVTTGQRLALLVGDILDFSRLKEGRLRLAVQTLHLPSIARSVAEVVSYTLDSKPIRIVQEYPDNLPGVRMDEDRLRQILYNLLGNSVKYTERGEIGIRACADDDWVTVEVFDTGIGIDREQWPEIFRPFERADEALGMEGAGLGLSITRQLVELGGGKIWLDSRPGEGTRFFFTLPASPAVPEPAGKSPLGTGAASNADELPEAGTNPPAADAGRVLIVDDDPVNRRVLLNLLSTAGYEAEAVAGGAEAMAFLERKQGVELVVTDWMMPGMSGPELCRKLRERYTLAQLPILLLTARGLPEEIRAGFESGANDFLSKPVDAGELRARVGTLIGMRRSAEEAVRTEMAFLQAQIKPHFLYNALNVIISACTTDPDKAIDLLIELSHYLRGSFDFRNRDRLVPLQKELELVHAYMALEQARFDDRLAFECVTDEPVGVFVPPLSIQPLVENAVRHGVMQRAAGGTVRLEIRDAGSAVSVRVTDDGVGLKAERFEKIMAGGEGGVGLRNIHRRLSELHGAALKLEKPAPGAGKGTTIGFDLPKNELLH
ncbi:hybrid sensor histidine kinase/response regulator [Saccharibacillus alkalitolerans]|uniref:histidine kinase n=1 Tax=Saccharibacillus alkalitolerans TaxID=2705290 RepID=A0ABX0FAR7_9BACL|nr:ATP-binding protein [Saccharibacillus alkalitolerans]NGZ76316.1 response regulator [Saccharibacillus alkalitolerans]